MKLCLVICSILLLQSVDHIRCEKDDDGFDRDDDNVYTIHDSDFDDFLKKFPTALIEFYAPWCGHCKTLAPEYSAAARTLKVHKQPVALAKVDATVETELAKRFKIEGFPTLKWWKEGSAEPSDYDGGRDHSSIVTWVRERVDPTYKPPPSVVQVLTQENFDSWTADKDIVLVEFYAPWCGHCKKLEPEYERAARVLKTRTPPVYLGKVDATVEKDLGKQYGVSGYPTLKILRRGKQYDYEGPREAQGIIDYMTEQSQPSAINLNSVTEAKNFMSKDDITILAFFSDDDTTLFKSFTDAAERMRGEYKFGYSLEPSIRNYFKAEPNQIRLYHPKILRSKHDKQFQQFDKKDATAEDVEAFINKNNVPLVGWRNMKQLKRYAGKEPLVVVYYATDFSFEGLKGTQFWRDRVIDVAWAHKDSTYTFAVANEEEFADELKNAGLDDSGMEVNVIVYGKDGKKYPWDPTKYDEEDFTVETFTGFMKLLKTNRVRPYIKSQPTPANNDKLPVKVATAGNFEKLVMDESKDVLIEFYAPWCGHCKKLEPIYESMATKLRADSGLLIAKMDATANDPHEKYGVEGFPTIYFAPAGKKESPIPYKGDRSMDDMIKFMKDNAVRSFQTKTEL